MPWMNETDFFIRSELIIKVQRVSPKFGFSFEPNGDTSLDQISKIFSSYFFRFFLVSWWAI